MLRNFLPKHCTGTVIGRMVFLIGSWQVTRCQQLAVSDIEVSVLRKQRFEKKTVNIQVLF